MQTQQISSRSTKTTPKKNLAHIQPSWHVWLLTHIISCCLQTNKDKLTLCARWGREFSLIRRVDWRDHAVYAAVSQHRAKPGTEITDTFLRTDEEIIKCRLQHTYTKWTSINLNISALSLKFFWCTVAKIVIVVKVN